MHVARQPRPGDLLADPELLAAAGTYYYDFGQPSLWFKKDGVWDFDRPFAPTRLMVKDPATGDLFMTSSCGEHCYSGPDNIGDHTPIVVNAQAIVVAKGAKLSPPESWVGCPGAWSPGCLNATNQPPTVNAGPDLAARIGGPVATLNGTASDDVRPNPPGVLTTTWSIVSGPGSVTFGSPNSATTTATFGAPGTYELRLTANDGAIGVERYHAGDRDRLATRWLGDPDRQQGDPCRSRRPICDVAQ